MFRKSVSTERGELTFTSTTTLDAEERRLRISEQHALVDDRHERVVNYDFVMRCWTTGELQAALVRSGFEGMAYYGAYDPQVGPGATDRLVAVAQQMRAARRPYAGRVDGQGRRQQRHR